MLSVRLDCVVGSGLYSLSPSTFQTYLQTLLTIPETSAKKVSIYVAKEFSNGGGIQQVCFRSEANFQKRLVYTYISPLSLYPPPKSSSYTSFYTLTSSPHMPPICHSRRHFVLEFVLDQPGLKNTPQGSFQPILGTLLYG